MHFTCAARTDIGIVRSGNEDNYLMPGVGRDEPHRNSIRQVGPAEQVLHVQLAGALDRATFAKDPVFGVSVPTSVPDVPPEILVPRRTWADPAAYDVQARKLAQMFRENFEQYRSGVSGAVAAAEPVLPS